MLTSGYFNRLSNNRGQSISTWSVLGKQNVQAKEVYLTPGKLEHIGSGRTFCQTFYKNQSTLNNWEIIAETRSYIFQMTFSLQSMSGLLKLFKNEDLKFLNLRFWRKRHPTAANLSFFASYKKSICTDQVEGHFAYLSLWPMYNNRKAFNLTKCYFNVTLWLQQPS